MKPEVNRQTVLAMAAKLDKMEVALKEIAEATRGHLMRKGATAINRIATEALQGGLQRPDVNWEMADTWEALLGVSLPAEPADGSMPDPLGLDHIAFTLNDLSGKSIGEREGLQEAFDECFLGIQQAMISLGISPPDVKLVADKYDHVLLPFLKLMQTELHANSAKGDRPAWLKMSREQVVLEGHWHLAKLQKAVLDGDKKLVAEHAADVANIAMMTADIFGLLAPLRQDERLVP